MKIHLAPGAGRRAEGRLWRPSYKGAEGVADGLQGGHCISGDQRCPARLRWTGQAGAEDRQGPSAEKRVKWEDG